MLCPSCQRFPLCSEAAILCIHAINPVFNMTKVGFSFSLVSKLHSLCGGQGLVPSIYSVLTSSRTSVSLSY